MPNIEISSILSSRTKEGKVDIHKDGVQVFQFDIAEAKRIHRMLGEAIEAAISDQIIYRFMKEKIGMEDEKATMVLVDFRELRQGTKGVLYQSDENEGN